jgi:hypothetical protein
MAMSATLIAGVTNIQLECIQRFGGYIKLMIENSLSKLGQSIIAEDAIFKKIPLVFGL